SETGSAATSASLAGGASSAAGAPMIVIASEGSWDSSNAFQPTASPSSATTASASTTGCAVARVSRGATKESRDVSHSITTTTRNAEAITSTMIHHANFATPSATATAIRNATSPAMRQTAGEIPSRVVPRPPYP